MDKNLTSRYCTHVARARNQLGVGGCFPLSEASSGDANGVVDEADAVLRRAAMLGAPPHCRSDGPTSAKAFHDDVIRRLAPPLVQVLSGFPISDPDETAELILDMVTSVSCNPRRDQILPDPLAQSRCTSAVREVIGATLGINKDNPALLEFR